MKLDVKSLALAGAFLWGVLCLFGVGVINALSPGYGQAVLDLAASIYPGYEATGGFGQILIGTGYGLLDGAICGALFAWVYNRCTGLGRNQLSPGTR